MPKVELNGRFIRVPHIWMQPDIRNDCLSKRKCLGCMNKLNVRNRDGLCMECRITYPELADYINPNRNTQNRRWRRRCRWLNKYKKAKGCAICGYNEHAVALDFDHIDKDLKTKEIGKLINGRLHKLFAELRKCRILCANCHRVHTQKQLGGGTSVP